MPAGKPGKPAGTETAGCPDRGMWCTSAGEVAGSATEVAVTAAAAAGAPQAPAASKLRVQHELELQ